MKHHCHNPHQIALIFLLFGLFFIESCVKDKDTLPTTENLYYYLTPEQIAQSPYFTNSKYDTLSFFNTKGDTFTFAKIKTDSTFNRVSFRNSGTGNATIYNYQYLHNTYQTLKGDGKFEVWHYHTNERGATKWIQIKLLNRNIEYGDDYLRNKYDEFTYYDSLEFRGINFRKAVRFYLYNKTLKDFSQWNYANAEDGIFTTYETNTNDTLFLLKK